MLEYSYEIIHMYTYIYIYVYMQVNPIKYMNKDETLQLLVR